MGFLIDSHEQECLELLRKIEDTRAQTKGAVSSRKLISPTSKGKRELKNLVSSVNYDETACALLRFVSEGLLGSWFLMKLKLVSWNVRGLNDPKKREVLKNWLRQWKMDVVHL